MKLQLSILTMAFAAFVAATPQGPLGKSPLGSTIENVVGNANAGTGNQKRQDGTGTQNSGNPIQALAEKLMGGKAKNEGAPMDQDDAATASAI